MAPSPIYKHTQRGTVTLVVSLLVPLVAVVFLLRSPAAPKVVFIPCLVVVILSTLLFSSLTISVGDKKLAWWFGIGVIRKSVPLEDIVSVEPVRTTFWQGWGIHFTRNGWLYNVSGYDAVLVRLRGGKRFMLGTNDVAGLRAAIRAADAVHAPPKGRT